MSDEWKAFVAIGSAFAAHDTVRHSQREYVRGSVHANSAEGFNDRVRRTIAGVFHHISPDYADLYFGEIGFRWSQRTVAGQAQRRTRKGRTVIQPSGPVFSRRSSFRPSSVMLLGANSGGPRMAGSASARP